MQANSRDWIAYALTPYNTGKELGVKDSDSAARTVCELHEAQPDVRRSA